MNKGRLEAFSDGVFSIVMTLLVFDIKLPTLPASATDAQLWAEIWSLAPLIVVYFISFAVLSTLWVNHHFLFHSFAKSVDRKLNLLNLAYLMFVAFVPFSAYFIGEYHTHQPAAIIYGLNIFIIVSISYAMVSYILKNRGTLLNDHITQRILNQARFRSTVSLYCYLFGITASFFSVHLSLFFFTFPILFNIIPGSLDLMERTLRFSLD